ncbi:MULTISPECIES: anthranilate synthase component I family protein [Cryobacterium]|uniref:Anthranilate synthase component I family protein n=1 Tax=Cryobacterium breve TaxID=1259258 RepID=A0ABY2IZ66_9MICO|nr:MULTISPECIES: anthranilate synthase component I family protein [Cryobacterium]TFC96691.1 anthranilate synthase component I family protein [Cryobacterium sp. TmT3-12]TFC97512.1 anthranilate synthase component I family protein [Cryobacterium breve]
MIGPILRIPLPEWREPARVFETLYHDSPYAFWLDAGDGAETGHSYLGASSPGSRFVTASVPAGTITVSVAGTPPVPGQTSPGTVFEFLRADLAGSAADSVGDSSTGTTPDAGGFRLGWVGWLGYELGAQTLGTPVHDSRYPDAALLEVHRVLVFDHAARTVIALARRAPGDPTDAPQVWVDTVLQSLAASEPPPAASVLSPAAVPAAVAAAVPAAVAAAVAAADLDAGVGAARWRHDAHRYAALIDVCQDFIRAGDAYQLCLTNEILVDVRPHPVDAYLQLRAGSPSHHGGLLRFGDTALLSASPEQFLAVTPHGRVTTKPIKGTRARSAGAVRDRALRDELEGSEKERAENLMIVDLMRNDLGRIAELGSVQVTNLLAVESYAHVHQLVSTVEARLAEGLTGVDAVASSFPAGSMTGAPKISALSILDALEGGPRGLYAGAFGYFGRDGAVDLAMVIRSIVLGPDGASIGTGGGITALSDPLEEIEETRLKAEALLAVLGVHPAGAATSQGQV